MGTKGHNLTLPKVGGTIGGVVMRVAGTHNLGRMSTWGRSGVRQLRRSRPVIRT